MERLTFEGNFCDIAQCRELPCKYDGDCTQKEVWERLKQFEDAIQTPEKATWAKKTIEMAFSDDPSKVERLRELYKADKDGRVIILPCDEYLRLLNEFAGIESRPTTEYNHYDENGEFIGSSVDTDLSDLLDEAGVEVRDDG